jgi:hypothetical protein
MRYELNGANLVFHAESGDPWKGVQSAQRIETISGVECVTCFGTVRNTDLKKDVRLCVRIDNKPGLPELVAAWTAAIKAEESRKVAEATAELDGITSGATPITVYYHDGEYLSGHTLHGPAANMLVKIGVAKDVSGWGVHVDSKLVEALGTTFTYPQAREFASPIIEKIEAAKAKAAEHDAAIELRRSELLASGKRLATPKQLGVIYRAKKDWFDLFDGATSYGMYGPSDDQLATMTIDEASALVGQIMSARKAGE